MRQVLNATAIATVVIGLSAPASARDGWNAAAAVMGAAGGLALGSALAANSYYPGKPVYLAPGPVIVEEEPVCYIHRRRYIDEFGDVTVRRTRVCD